MAEIARKDDTVSTGHGCTGTTKLDTPTQTKVFVQGQLVACQGDKTIVHTIESGDNCVDHIGYITGASSTVFIGGAKAAMKGDVCDAGTITSGASTVFIG